MNNQYVNGPALCKIYKISAPTLRKWRAQGVPCFFTGAQSYRYDTVAVGAWLARRR